MRSITTDLENQRQTAKYSCFFFVVQSFAYRRFLVNGFDDKFLVIERNVSDLTPGEADLRGHPEQAKRKTGFKKLLALRAMMVSVTV